MPLPPPPQQPADTVTPAALSGAPQRSAAKRRTQRGASAADPHPGATSVTLLVTEPAQATSAGRTQAPPQQQPDPTPPTSHRRKAQSAALLAAPVAPTPAAGDAPASADAATPTRARGQRPGRASEPAPQVNPTAVVGVASAVKPTRRANRRHAGPSKLFVLDTNVLLHDPSCLFRFEEHDIYLPMIVLEELDAHKKGMTEVARNGRQVSRLLDALAEHPDSDMASGLPLAAGLAASTGADARVTGRLFFQTEPLDFNLPASLPQGKADNQILGVVDALRRARAPREVVLVSKDINMRVKARALGLPTEDYQNDKALEDGDLLYTGALALPPDFWSTPQQTVESWQQGAQTWYRIGGPLVAQLLVNQFVFFEAAGEPSLYARVAEIRGHTAVLRTLKDYTHLKNAVWGVTTRNREQNFAMNLLMDPDVDFVTLAGTAGSGKTLLALAAGLTQVLDDRRYTEIIVTRATVSVGEDIGFLPGTEEEKMGPWMGALDDNLEVLGKTDSAGGDWGRAATHELIRSRIKIKSMNFMRGRTFLNRYVIVDEAQNLTPKQMKTLITRAGPGTKIVCMGNLAQIDTPYLTEGASGLTFAVDRFKGWPHSGHITLARGERSRLADFASEVL